jgi:hypothetical protein
MAKPTASVWPRHLGDYRGAVNPGIFTWSLASTYGRVPVNNVFSSTKLIGLPNGSFAQNMRSPQGIFWMPPSTIAAPASIARW